MTGLNSGQLTDKFNTMASKLAGMGYNVVKPAAVNEDSPNWDLIVRSDIKKMLECDEVHLLPDWQDSRSARLYRDIALRVGMSVVYY
jgi:hypothetical protein